MDSTLELRVYAGAILAVAALVWIFTRPITRFLQIHYSRIYGDGFARLISVWTTRAFALAVTLLGSLMLIFSLLPPPQGP
jgi:hypothetical protein